MHNASFSDLNQSWSHLAATVAAAPGLVHMHPHLEELRQALEEARDAEQRQLAHRAAAQQATRELEQAKLRAHEAAVRLRSGLWSHYGRNCKELIAFGLRPYPTVRPRKPKEEPSPRATGSPRSVGEPFPNAPAPALHERKLLPNSAAEPPLQDERSCNVGERLPNDPGPSLGKGSAHPKARRRQDQAVSSRRLHVGQARIVPDHGNLLTQIRQDGEPVPRADQVIRRRGQQPRGIDRLAPVGSSDLRNGLPVRKQPEVPRCAEADEEVDSIRQGADLLRDIRIRVESAVNPRGHREAP